SDRRLTRAVEHLFQGAHGDAQEPANLDGGDFAASGGTVRPISTQTEISLSGLWHRDRKRGDDFFVHVGFRLLWFYYGTIITELSPQNTARDAVLSSNHLRCHSVRAN